MPNTISAEIFVSCVSVSLNDDCRFSWICCWNFNSLILVFVWNAFRVVKIYLKHRSLCSFELCYQRRELFLLINFKPCGHFLLIIKSNPPSKSQKFFHHPCLNIKRDEWFQMFTKLRTQLFTPLTLFQHELFFLFIVCSWFLLKTFSFLILAT